MGGTAPCLGFALNFAGSIAAPISMVKGGGNVKLLDWKALKAL
jgi:hypothetical protein